MLVTRKSNVSGITRTMDLPITEEQMSKYESGTLAQHAFPDLQTDLREFIISGITPDEWDMLFSTEYDDD